MICPHCNTGIRFEPEHTSPVFVEDQTKRMGYDVVEGFCSECAQFLVILRRGRYFTHDFNDDDSRELLPDSWDCIYPAAKGRRQQPVEVPDQYRSDYEEAANVILVSPKASAAISRRMLQQILREEFKISRKNLAEEIGEFVGSPTTPSHLSDAIDAVRKIGNLAAHPTKNLNTGEIVQVEPGEAEWLLDVLDSLLDFTFVQPKRLAVRKANLDSKLAVSKKAATP